MPTKRPTILSYLLMLPIAIWLAAFVIAPAAIMVVYSFCTRDELGEVVYQFTTDNYHRALAGVYWSIFLRSIELAALTTALCLLIGYPAAYFIARSSPRTRSTLLLLVMIPFWTSFLIRAYAWMTILKDQGLLNASLTWAKLIPSIMNPTALLYTPTAVLIGMVYSYLPFMMLPIYVSAEKLDPSLIEAAMDLGAPPLSVFRRVILPLTRPGIYAGILLVFVPAIGMFAIQDLLGGASHIYIGTAITNQFGLARDMPFGATLGVLLMLLFILSFALLGRRQAVWND
ncbi:MAG TPA: ABC transporter permease [Tepidisphaeraceae bacterium]|jgi:spermidine/putrescine transport system permease protein|nr:ABC transporter permease [Tepidisphaeraceae bacterium]